MTRDEIIKLASQAIDDTRSAVSLPIPFVMRFAVLVAAAERKECAKLCGAYWESMEEIGEDDYQTGRARAAVDLQNAITTRSQPARGEG